MEPLFMAAGADPGLWPFGILLICVGFIIVSITWLRLHPFLALILTALIAGWLTPADQLPGDQAVGGLVRTVDLVLEAFGETAGGVGVVIALAAIIGLGLMESGAADKIVRRFMAFFGEKKAGIALLCSGFFLSIPVFFDTVFFLLIPLARALGLRTGKNYLYFVMAIAGGGAITHSIVPPTPGPLLVGEMIGLELGATIVTGLIAGVLPAIGVLWMAKWMDLRMPIPLRETTGATLSDLHQVAEKPEEQLPAFGVAILPVVLPVLLIAIASFLSMAKGDYDETGEYAIPGVIAMLGGTSGFNAVYEIFEFLGNKVVALFFGAGIALWLYMRQAGLNLTVLGQKLASPLETAGLIILITSAGGAFGAMIRHAGVGDAIKEVAQDRDLNYILLAWFVTAVVRIAQGSATVSMITGAGLMAAVIGDGTMLPYHPIYIFLAVGFGSITCSWMNDSGFWIVGKLSGMTEKETLKTWTVLLTMIAVVGLIETLVFSVILPLK